MYKIDINEFIDFELGALLIVLVRVEDYTNKAVVATIVENTLEKGYLEDL